MSDVEGDSLSKLESDLKSKGKILQISESEGRKLREREEEFSRNEPRTAPTSLEKQIGRKEASVQMTKRKRNIFTR